jgi:hypothetical protein
MDSNLLDSEPIWELERIAAIGLPIRIVHAAITLNRISAVMQAEFILGLMSDRSEHF